MTGQHPDSERFLQVARGRGRWSGAEEAHLDACADCRLEWRITAAAAGLGGGENGVPADVEATAESVLRRLADARAGSRRARRAPVRWLVGVAAAAAVVLILFDSRPPVDPTAGPRLAVLHELDDLTAAQLESVLETLPPAADQVPHLDPSDLGDLDAEALERVLHSME